MTRPWRAWRPEERSAAVRELAAAGQADSIIGRRLSAPAAEIARIAALIRRETWAPGNGQESGAVPPAARNGPAARPAGESAASLHEMPPAGPSVAHTDAGKSDGDPCPVDAALVTAGETALISYPREPTSSPANAGKPGAAPPSSAPGTLPAPAVDRAAVAAMRAAGMAWADIAARLGVSVQRAYAAAARNGDMGAAVLRLRAEGLTGSEIGKRLGISRCAVSGYVSRMRASGAAIPPAAQPHNGGRGAKSPKPRAKRAAAPKPRIAAAPKPTHHLDFAGRAEDRASARGLPVDRAAAFEPLSGAPAPIGMMSLTSYTCRWPVNGLHGRADLYCGRATEPDCVWCGIHKALAYAPHPLRQREQKKAERALA